MPLLGISERIELDLVTISGSTSMAAPSPPVAVEVGDLLTAFLVSFVRRTPWTGGTVGTSIAGWTATETVGSAAIAINGRIYQATMYYRIADGTSDDAPNATFTHTGSNSAEVAAHLTYMVWRGADYELYGGQELGGGASSTVTSPASTGLPDGGALLISFAANLALFTTPTLNTANGFTEIYSVDAADIDEVNLMPLAVAVSGATGPGTASWPQWNVTQGDSANEEHAAGVVFKEVIPAPPTGWRWAYQLGGSSWSWG